MITDIKREKFKVNGKSKWFTKALFLEAEYKTDHAVFTLWDEDREYKGKTYYSLKKAYLEMEDPTEYEFATTYLGGWSHWLRICENEILIKHVEEWRNELELRIRAHGIRAMINEAKMGGRSQASAARWLAEKGFISKPSKQSVGRPKKDETEREEAQKKELKESFKDDLQRLKLVD